MKALSPQQLDTRITTTIERALASGALQPIETEQDVVEDAGIPFVVRWVSALARKRLKSVNASGRRANYNPFLPHDPALEIEPLGEAHLALLNKFPVMDRHLLVITRSYEEQTAPLTPADFAALWSIIERLGGMGFCNGGRDAGASQHHKHLQWIPAAPDNPSSVPIAAALRAAVSTAARNAVPGFHFVHAFARLGHSASKGGENAGERLHRRFAELAASLDIRWQQNPLPPYNLLLTRDWMLLVPRSQENWLQMSINSLGFAGLLFVAEKSQLAAVRAAGPLEVLRSVTAER